MHTAQAENEALDSSGDSIPSGQQAIRMRFGVACGARWRGLALPCLLIALQSCGGSPKRRPSVAANVQIGDCADPKTAGVLSATPKLKAAHRDLNGDGVPERVYADRRLCHSGNCSWNLFAETDGCSRYIGTMAGSTLELGMGQGEAGFSPLRVWWKMGSGGRYLVQNYRYISGGYQLDDVLLCRQEGDDRLLCASEEPQEPSTDD